MTINTLNGLRKLFNAYNSVKLTTEEKRSIVKDLKIKGYKLSEISKITKINKGQISMLVNNKKYSDAPRFDFYDWLDQGFNKIIDDTIPLSSGQKMQLETLILKLSRIRGKIK